MESEVTRMVNTYKRTRDPKLLEEIMDKMQPLINSTVNKFALSGLDPSILREQVKIYVKQAIDNYTPGKGNFEAFASGYVRQTYRFVNNYQHPIRLPENYKLNYERFDTTFSELKTQLHRTPLPEEVSRASGLPLNQVQAFMSRQISPLEEGWVGKTHDDTLALKEAIALVRARYGEKIAKAVEKVLKGAKISDVVRELGLDYMQTYQKIQQALKDVDKFLLTRQAF